MYIRYIHIYNLEVTIVMLFDSKFDVKVRSTLCA